MLGFFFITEAGRVFSRVRGYGEGCIQTRQLQCDTRNTAEHQRGQCAIAFVRCKYVLRTYSVSWESIRLDENPVQFSSFFWGGGGGMEETIV